MWVASLTVSVIMLPLSQIQHIGEVSLISIVGTVGMLAAVVIATLKLLMMEVKVAEHEAVHSGGFNVAVVALMDIVFTFGGELPAWVWSTLACCLLNFAGMGTCIQPLSAKLHHLSLPHRDVHANRMPAFGLDVVNHQAVYNKSLSVASASSDHSQVHCKLKGHSTVVSFVAQILLLHIHLL